MQYDSMRTLALQARIQFLNDRLDYARSDGFGELITPLSDESTIVIKRTIIYWRSNDVSNMHDHILGE